MNKSVETQLYPLWLKTDDMEQTNISTFINLSPNKQMLQHESSSYRLQATQNKLNNGEIWKKYFVFNNNFKQLVVHINRY